MTDERRSTWVDGIADRLIRSAASGAPGSLSERLAEEWRADLAERHGSVSRLSFALGCCWAVRLIAYEHRGVAMATAAPALTRSTGAVWGDDETHFLSRRSAVLFLVVGLHVAVFCGLALGLPGKFIKVIERPLVIRPAPPVATPERPRLAPPTLSPTRLYVTPPENVPVSQPQEDDRPAVVTSTPQPATGAPGVVQAVKRVQGGPGVGFPDTDDYYPSASRFLHEQGVAVVQVCVSEAGRLTAAPSIVTSSGFARLDESAIRLAKSGSGHYRASTEDARPVSSCYPFRIRFALRD